MRRLRTIQQKLITSSVPLSLAGWEAAWHSRPVKLESKGSSSLHGPSSTVRAAADRCPRLVAAPRARSSQVRRLLALGAAALALLLPSLAIAGDEGPPPGADSPPWDGETFRRQVDAATGISFDLPMLGFRLETRHFDPKAPASQVKHSFTLSGPDGLEAGIDVFDNPDNLELRRFFETYLGFMGEGEAAVTEGPVGPRKVAALLVEQPRAPGSYAQPSAVFMLAGRVFRVTCANEDNERAVKVYLRVLASLEVGKAVR